MPGQDIKFADKLNVYYDEVISVLRDAESIFLFGPGEAKGELKKRLEEDHLDHHIQVVETVDQMADRQIAAKVREHFKLILPSAKKVFLKQRYASDEIDTEKI